MSSTDPRPVRVSLDLDQQLHRQAKAAAALQGVTLRELAARALRGYVQQTERPVPTIFAKGGPAR